MIFFWYLVAGGLATAVHYLVLLVLVEGFGWAAASAAVVGALLGAAASYVMNRWLTFSGTLVRHTLAVPRFLLVAGVGAALNGALVWAGVHVLAWHYMAAQAAATLVVLGLTYRLNRFWTFA
ncbi:MAG: GtrA family protein [Chitinophagaceae bacterium]|nr:GtrA family protein [Polaromonas sp.]